MTRIEMIQALAENPKRKALQTKSKDGMTMNAVYEVCKNGEISIGVYVKNDLSEWEIIEPPKKLREMEYGEAVYWLFKDKNKLWHSMKSCVTSEDAARDFKDVSFQEYLGKWTVEGIYEEDNDGS